MATLTTSFNITVLSDEVRQRNTLNSIMSSAASGDEENVYGQAIYLKHSNGATTEWWTQDIADNGDVTFVAYSNGIYGNFADAGTASNQTAGFMQLCKTDPTSAISWKNTDLRAFLNNEYYNTLPTWIKERIKRKTFKYQIGNWNQVTNYDEVTDYIRIPTLANIIGPPASTNTTWKALEGDLRYGVRSKYGNASTIPSKTMMNFRSCWTATPYKNNPGFVWMDQSTSTGNASLYKVVKPSFIIGA